MAASGKVLFEAADVGRALGVVPATVKKLTVGGRLPVAARTPRGTRLFLPADVEELRKRRAMAPPQAAVPAGRNEGVGDA